MFNSSGEKEERLEKNGKTGDRPFVSQYMMRRVSRRTLIPFPTFPRRGGHLPAQKRGIIRINYRYLFFFNPHP